MRDAIARGKATGERFGTQQSLLAGTAKGYGERVPAASVKEGLIHLRFNSRLGKRL